METVIRPHPENTRYFLFRGKPTVLITSTEHYGAVSNAAFDYVQYLDMLASYGFNLSRMVVVMREAESEFKGLVGWQNTVAPRPENYIGPWKRSNVPGHLDGLNKVDLDVWNEDYFTRLKDFCSKAAERGIIVEVAFFSQNYNNNPDSPWTLNPLNPANNSSGEGASGFNRYLTCENSVLLKRQDDLVRKVVAELEGLDNIYFEICNEPPYPEDDNAELPADHPDVLGEKAISEWHNHIASVIMDAEETFEQKHMISADDPHEHLDFQKFSIFNYHYRQWSENGLKRHFALKKVLAFDETLTGIVSWNRELLFDDRRMEAWEFFMRGFAVYDYLDFTIATDDPRGEGNAVFPDGQRYDGTVLRIHLKMLKDFMDSIDYIHMTPDNSIIKSISDTAKAWALANAGEEYALYIRGSALKAITVELPRGMWRAEWYSPTAGKIHRASTAEGGGDVALEIPPYQTDIALRLKRIDNGRI